MLVNLKSPPTSDEKIYSDFFKAYSVVIKKWLETIFVPGKTIHVHYGSSERIWTKLIRNRRNYSIDLPICSFFLPTWKRDDAHNQPPEVQRMVGGNFLNAKPGFYKLNYDITWWMKYLKETDLIKYQIESLFTPDLWLEVENNTWKNVNGMPYWINCKMTDFSDAYEMEPGDKADRVLKVDLKIEVEGKLSYIAQGSVGKPMQKINFDVGLDNEIDKKKELIKDNIQEDNYLSNVLDYYKKH